MWRHLFIFLRILRLEFNHCLLPYYTELDAVLLRGKEPANESKIKNNFAYSSLFYKKTQPPAHNGKFFFMQLFRLSMNWSVIWFKSRLKRVF